MIKMYATLVESGRKNFFDVPERLSAAVRAKIEEDGYEIDKDGWAVKR